MCGISGMLGNANQETALAMADCLSHRGPDGVGGFYDELKYGAVAFGHARLSIVDLKGSSQPIGSLLRSSSRLSGSQRAKPHIPSSSETHPA